VKKKGNDEKNCERVDQIIDKNTDILEASLSHGYTCSYSFSHMVKLQPSKRGSISNLVP
jgi:hypothetical protein